MWRSLLQNGLAFGLFLGAIAYAQSPQPGQSAPTVELPRNIQETLAGVHRAEAVNARLKQVKLDVKGAFSVTRVERNFEQLENGLWGVMETFPGRTGMGSSLTLQGLVELAVVMETSAEITTALPAGKIFLPFSINRGAKHSIVRNTSGLAGDLSAIVNPVPRSRFSYRHAQESQLTIAGLFGSTRNLRHETSVQCDVGEASEATALHPKLRGSYLPVSCEGTTPGARPHKRELIYLPESRIYILLSVMAGDSEERYTITDAEYGPR